MEDITRLWVCVMWGRKGVEVGGVSIVMGRNPFGSDDGCYRIRINVADFPPWDDA